MITENMIGFERSAKGKRGMKAINPADQTELKGDFAAATDEEIDLAATKAWKAWKEYRHYSGKQKAEFLRAIADEIEALGNDLVERVTSETGLPEGRVVGERGRTCSQLRMFASLVEEGSWVEAAIDTAQPKREPVPKTDIRRMRVALGPVAVFTASNFPLAFSTAGGDTASALAAGCPVIVKAHWSHLGTNALVSEAILKAAKKTKMPDGVFSSLQGPGNSIGQTLVRHPLIKAVGFTGSFNGGTALWKAANERTEPIPVFAEMGSINPVFVLPQLISESTQSIANTIAGSVNLGAGQFCTNPGLLVLLEDQFTGSFIDCLQKEFSGIQPATMLNETIYKSYNEDKRTSLKTHQVTSVFAPESGNSGKWIADPAIASVNAETYLDRPNLHREVFGPYTLIVRCKTKNEMLEIAEAMKGQLTTSITGTEAELQSFGDLFQILQSKAGRVIFNGVPTGVEVCPSMHHGGPFPATTDSRFTSVGTSAILRFSRPVSFQNCPVEMLPDELKDNNPLNIWRLVDGKWSRK